MNEAATPIDAASVIETLQDFTLGETRQEITLQTRDENRIIAAHMAQQATRTLRIFTRELEPAIYDQPDFVDACKRLALESRFSRIEILAFDSKRIIQRGHQLVELTRKLSSSMEIRCPTETYNSRLETFITVDGAGFIYRKLADRFDGIANFNDPLETREMDKLFTEIWQHSHVDPEMRRLHL